MIAYHPAAWPCRPCGLACRPAPSTTVMHTVDMRRYTKTACKQCQRPAAEVGPLSWQGFCVACGMARFIEANYSPAQLAADSQLAEIAEVAAAGPVADEEGVPPPL